MTTPDNTGPSNTDLARETLTAGYRRGQPRLSRGQVNSLYLLYRKAGFSIPRLAELTWARLGYRSARSAAEMIRRAFRRGGYPIRTHGQAARARKQRRDTP